jgi:hypothetical protein
VSLWRETATIEARPGDHVTISDVTTNYYNSQTTLQTSLRSTIKVHVCFYYKHSSMHPTQCFFAIFMNGSGTKGIGKSRNDFHEIGNFLITVTRNSSK